MQAENRPAQTPEVIKQDQNGQKLHLEVKIPPDSEVEVLCNFVDSKGELIAIRSLSAKAPQDSSRWQIRKKISWSEINTILLFWLALVFYLGVRLIGLEDFPIYFFSDEAIQSVQAADLIRDNYFSPLGEFFPTFFENGGQYNLSTSVYYQVIPVRLFGKEIWATRGATALLSVLAAIGVGILIQKGFRTNSGWLAILVLSLMPAWFLHSRTAFETAMAVSFYAGFAGFYLLYRKVHPRYLYVAVVLATLAFYSYSPMRVILGLTLLGLLISDGRYHWQHKSVFLKSFGLGLVFLLPFVRFSLDHPGESIRHLEILGSYWVQDLPVSEKLSLFLREYIRGLNPLYWYLPNQVDLPRHLMKGYGHLWQAGLPFLLAGIYWGIKHIREPISRITFIMLFAAPSGAAMVQLGITRALVMVIPATLFTVIGVVQIGDWILGKIGKQNRYTTVLKSGVFVTLVLINIHMLVDALQNGPTWFKNYGLYGMQYGAKQVFGHIENQLKNDPGAEFYLTSAWANGADVLARYFFDDPIPFQMGSIEGFIHEYKPIQPGTIFVMTKEERQSMLESQKFTNISTDNVIAYPDGEPGFYFIRLDYVENIQNIFASELADRRKMNTGTVSLPDGTEIEVEYSTLDIGEIKHVFDGDKTTLVRSWEANPLRMIVHFPEEREISQLVMRVGGEPTRVEAELWSANTDKPVVLSEEVSETTTPRFLEMDLPQPSQVNRVEIRVFNLNNAEPAHVHLWELQFYP